MQKLRHLICASSRLVELAHAEYQGLRDNKLAANLVDVPTKSSLPLEPTPMQQARFQYLRPIREECDAGKSWLPANARTFLQRLEYEAKLNRPAVLKLMWEKHAISLSREQQESIYQASLKSGAIDNMKALEEIDPSLALKDPAAWPPGVNASLLTRAWTLPKEERPLSLAQVVFPGDEAVEGGVHAYPEGIPNVTKPEGPCFSFDPSYLPEIDFNTLQLEKPIGCRSVNSTCR